METEMNGQPEFDLEALRLSQDFADELGVKQELVTVPVRKPHRQEFIRVHSDESYRFNTAVLELKPEGDNYLIAPTLLPELKLEVTPKT